MKHTFLILIFLCSALGLTAQFDFVERPAEVMHNELNITFVPHYVLFNGLRFDIERLNGRKAWVVSPQFYYLKRDYHPISYSDASLKSLIGGGMGVYRKFIRSSTEKSVGYWAIGLGTNYYSVDYDQFTWVAKSFYDQTVYDYELVNRRGSLLQINASATIGIQYRMWNFLIVEPYVGVGYRYTMPFLPDHTNPFDNMLSFGYSGPVFLVGIKLGSGKSFSQDQF